MNSIQSISRLRRAFSLVEVLTVVSIISLVAGFSAPALHGLTSANNVQTGARLMAGWLDVARSEAIARHTLVRFVVAQEWSGKAQANLRKVSLWAWEPDAERFFPFTAWQELPVGVVLEPTLPDYLSSAPYAQDDRSSIRGDYVLDENGTGSDFDTGPGEQPAKTAYLEFTAAGNARMPAGTARQAIFVLTPGAVNADGSLTRTSNAGGHAANWAQINVDRLTGRVRVYQP